MAALRPTRVFLTGAVIALVLAYPALPCVHSVSDRHTVTDASQPDKNKNERCRRGENSRAPGKNCSDGGERLPQDKRSPLDKIPPLSPLVA